MAGTLMAMLVPALLLSTPDSLTRAQAIERAKSLLGQEKNLAAKEMTVVEAVAADWSDGSLGCPRRGMRSIQVLTSGYRVILRAKGQTHDVRVAASEAVICEKDRKREAMPGSDELQAASALHDKVREDLARRLDVPVSEVKVNYLKPTTWPDKSLGCPQPGKTYAQVRTRGFSIEAEHRGRAYAYHADLETVIYCGP
jgi:hypothetical protein